MWNNFLRKRRIYEWCNPSDYEKFSSDWSTVQPGGWSVPLLDTSLKTDNLLIRKGRGEKEVGLQEVLSLGRILKSRARTSRILRIFRSYRILRIYRTFRTSELRT